MTPSISVESRDTLGYIPNIEDYATLHPYGFLRGDHGLISSEEQENPEDTLYIGFGSFYKEGGIRWVDVVSRLKKKPSHYHLLRVLLRVKIKFHLPGGQFMRKL